MANRKAVDGRTDRARRRLRCIKAEVADFCAERAGQIVREECGDWELWSHRGGRPAMPVQWPIEVGEFVHNLRSALDHLVWQLAVAHRDCAGLRAGDACPGRHNRFPIHDIPGGWRGVRLHWSLEDLLPRLLELPKEYDLHPRLNSRFIAREVAVLSQGALRAAPAPEQMAWAWRRPAGAAAR